MLQLSEGAAKGREEGGACITLFCVDVEIISQAHLPSCCALWSILYYFSPKALSIPEVPQDKIRARRCSSLSRSSPEGPTSYDWPPVTSQHPLPTPDLGFSTFLPEIFVLLLSAHKTPFSFLKIEWKFLSEAFPHLSFNALPRVYSSFPCSVIGRQLLERCSSLPPSALRTAIFPAPRRYLIDIYWINNWKPPFSNH